MPRESADTKAARYLAEGRLVVTRVDGNLVTATCRGDGQIYVLGRDQRGWYCTCPALGRCSHLLALGRVVALTAP